MSTAPVYPEKGMLLLTVPTPNGMKVTLALEELKQLYPNSINYESYKVDFSKNEQKEPWFLDLNPNGRIPALVDIDNQNLKVWETGSILQYLVKKYDPEFGLHFQDEADEVEMTNWVFFQHGGLGPMQGQAGHFLNAAPEKLPYAAKRYIDETKRLFQVYEDQLAGESAKGGQAKDYLIGSGKGKYSLADIVAVTWVRAHPYSLGTPSLVSPTDGYNFPHLQRWIERIEARPAGKLAFNESEMINALKAKEGWEEETRKRVEFLNEAEKKKKEEQQAERKKDEL